MKWYNKLIAEIGTDKVLHVLCGFIVTSLFSGWSFEALLVGVLAAVVAGIAKEKADEKADWEDAIATGFGGILAVIVFGVRMALMGF